MSTSVHKAIPYCAMLLLACLFFVKLLPNGTSSTTVSGGAAQDCDVTNLSSIQCDDTPDYGYCPRGYTRKFCKASFSSTTLFKLCGTGDGDEVCLDPDGLCADVWEDTLLDKTCTEVKNPRHKPITTVDATTTGGN